jgi:TonB family protein
VPTKASCRIIKPIALGLGGMLFSMGLWAGSGEARILSRSDPEFPREAMLAGAQSGHVRARVTVSGAGEVVRVEILDAEPRRVFDRAVVKSLSLWRFDTGSDGRFVEIDVEFHR